MNQIDDGKKWLIGTIISVLMLMVFAQAYLQIPSRIWDVISGFPSGLRRSTAFDEVVTHSEEEFDEETSDIDTTQFVPIPDAENDAHLRPGFDPPSQFVPIPDAENDAHLRPGFNPELSNPESQSNPEFPFAPIPDSQRNVSQSN